MENHAILLDGCDLYVPDGCAFEEACRRVTHMAIGAHQDDLEIFAYHGIAACFEGTESWFAGVTVTDGGGSARSGAFAGYSDEQMKATRAEEQRKAARIGRYALQAQLGYASGAVKNCEASRLLVDQLECLLRLCRPRTLYLHNPLDKHDTHIATLTRCVQALRRLAPVDRPERIYGCEVWRDLDWVCDASKVALPVDAYPELATELIAVFASQIAGGKDYTQATLGRRRANATFFEPRAVDQASAYTFAIDLRPVIDDPSLSLAAYADGFIQAFRLDAHSRIERFAT